MSTWEIMLGIEAISTCVSLGAILYFMFKKDESEATDAAGYDFDTNMNPFLHA